LNDVIVLFRAVKNALKLTW